jgi:hypothetical protein
MLWRLAAFVASATQTDSVRRWFYRFFQFVRLDGALAARVVVDLLRLSGKPWVLAIDRTNWDFGKTTINILMISVVWNGMGIPLLWTLLPTAGNSNTSERTELLDRLRTAFPDLKIAALMGDREFIGDAWRLTGYFQARPLQIDFDLLFQNISGQWRLFGIAVATGSDRGQQDVRPLRAGGGLRAGEPARGSDGQWRPMGAGLAGRG